VPDEAADGHATSMADRAYTLTAGTYPAPRPGCPQDWRHVGMPKGFVSERDFNLRGGDLRICFDI
jgi:hypothetical protein